MKVRYFEKRPSQWWLDFRIAGERQRVPSGCATKEAAQAAAPNLIAEAVTRNAKAPAVATRPAKGTVPLVTLRGAFVLAMRTREKWIMSKAKGTLETTFSQLRVDENEDVLILTRDYVRLLRGRWLVEPGKRTGTTLTASTINHRLSMLTVLLETVDGPAHGVKHLKTKGNSRKRRVTDTELAAMQSWCMVNAGRKGALDFAALIAVGIGTGARQGELLDIKWADVAATSLTFRATKNDLTRTIPLRPAPRAVLEARRGLPAPFAGLTADRVTALWNEMREAMGLKADALFVFHLLRHESVNRMIDEGKNAFAIQAWHGHESIKTTEGYGMVGMAALRAAGGMAELELAA